MLTPKELQQLADALNDCGLSARILPMSQALSVWLPIGNGQEGQTRWTGEGELPRLLVAMLDALEANDFEPTLRPILEMGARYECVGKYGRTQTQNQRGSGPTRTEAVAECLIKAHAAGSLTNKGGA